MQVGSLIIDLRADIARLQSDMDKANRTVGGAMQKIERQAKLAMNAIGGIVGAVGVRELAQAADSYTKLTAQLKLATRSADEYAQAYSNVQRIARSAQADLSATAQVYARLSNALRDTGASQQQVADISETISLALRVNGATAAETASAMLQLSQAFGSGRLAGEEFRAVSEAAPGLLRELARAIGVPVGALKEMAKEGKLTTDVLANAWTNPAYLAGLREQVKEVATISSAIVVLKNNFITLIGEMDKANGASKSIANGILFLADQMAFLADMAYGTIEVFKQFGRSLAVVFNDIKTFGQVAGMSTNIVQAIMNKDEIAAVLRQREEFTKAANEDLEKFLNSNFRRFRDAMRESREEAAKPYDDKPLKAYGKAVDEAATKAEKLRQTQALKDLQFVIDEEEAQRETRERMAYEEREKACKELEKSEKERADLIMKRNKEISDEYLRTVKEQNDKAQREYDRFYDRLSQSITDALFRGFESGKDFIQNFKDTLIRAFQTLILQPQIEMIVKGSGVGALFGLPGIANAGDLVSGGGLLSGNAVFQDGIMQQNAGIIDTLRGGFGSLNTNVVGSIEKLGTFLSTGQGGLADKIGGFMGQYSGQIAGALSFAPAVFSLLKGDIKGAAFQGGGAAIGTLLGGPVGGAIGSFLGGALGGMFGGKKQPPRSAGMGSASIINGQFTSSVGKMSGRNTLDSGIAGATGAASSQFVGTLGNLFNTFGLSGDISATTNYGGRAKGSGYGNFNAMVGGQSYSLSQRTRKGFGEADMQRFLGEVLGTMLKQAIQGSGISQAFKALFNNVNGVEQTNRFIAASGGLMSAQKQLSDRFGLTADAAARVSNATGMVGDELIAFVGKLTNSALAFKKPSEMILESRASIQKGLNQTFGTVVQDAVWQTVTRQVEVTPKSYTTGFGNWGNNINGYGGRSMGGFGNWGFQVQKQFQTVTEQVLTYVDRVIPKTTALPQTLAEYDALLKSINTSTAAGAKMFAEVFSMRDQFIQFTAAVDGLKANVKSALFPMLSAGEQQAIMQEDLAKLFGELNMEVPGSIQELIALGKSIDYTTETGLDLAAAFPSLVQAFQQTKGAVDELMNSLRLGPDRFKTLFDLTRAQAYVRGGISLDSLPSYDVGTAYVPQDGPAMIHKGERILTAAENRSFGAGNAEMVNELRALRQEVKELKTSSQGVEKHTRKMSDVLVNVTEDGEAMRTEAV